MTGWARKKYERSHIAGLAYYDMYRDELKGMIKEPDKKIMPKSWKRELEKLEPDFKAMLGSGDFSHQESKLNSQHESDYFNHTWSGLIRHCSQLQYSFEGLGDKTFIWSGLSRS